MNVQVKKWECSEAIGETLKEKPNLQLNVQNPLPRVSVRPTSGIGCGDGGRHQSESRHAALQRGLLQAVVSKDVANVIVM